MTGPRSAAPAQSYKRENRIRIQSFSTVSSDSEDEGEFTSKHAGRAQMRGGHERVWTAKSVLLVATCTSSMILNISCQNSASVALPLIGREFNVTEAELQWIVSGYSLSSGCLLIFVGRLADLHGRKKAFLLGVAWLLVFSIACGFAKDIVSLNVLRALQGLGAAAFVPASLGILAHAFPISRARSIAFATFSAGAPVGGGLGMQMGGLLTQLAPSTWRATFFLSASLAALIIIGGLFAIDKDTPSTEEDRRVDWLGAGLVTASLTLIQFALGQGPLAPNRWGSPYIITSFIAGFLLLSAFIGWQYHLERASASSQKSRSPLMKLSMWKRAKGKFAVMQCIAFLEYAAFQSWLFWSQLYYQNYVGLSPIRTAIRFLPMPITGILCSILVAFIIGSVDVVFLVVCGTLMTGIAGLLFAVIDPSASYWAYGFPSAIVSVFGADFVFPSGTLFVAKVSLPHEQSLAGGMFQTLTQLGTAMGLAVTTIVHDATLRLEAPNESTELYSKPALHAYKAAQWGAFAIAITGSILAATFLRGVGPVGHRKDVDKLTESFSEGFQTHTQDSNSSFAVGKSSSVLVPSLEITRYKNNPLSESSSNKVSPESLYMVWKQPDLEEKS